jgi:Mg2+ and Co2+ transporter CorA
MAAKSWGCRIGLYTCANMGRIILISGVNGEAVENYPAKSLGRPESIPAPPFWLDLLSPSEHLLCRISNGLKLHPRVQRACLSRHREPSCEDFNDYLFIQTSLLEPSRTNLFIKRDIKIILSREYLITSTRAGLHCRVYFQVQKPQGLHAPALFS